MNRKTIITTMFALVAMAGQGQTFTPVVEDSGDHGVGSSDHFSN